MATVSTSDGWMTSFIYEQDLTSVYMNSVLYSLFRPGIYNANYILKPGPYSTDSNSDFDGLTLLIKKGTTFVFSNDYLDVYKQQSTYNLGDTLYRRSFTNNVPESAVNSGEGSLVGNAFPVVIKCVAMRDILVTSIARASEGSEDMSIQPWGGGEETSAPSTLYLCAYIKYDQSGIRANNSVPEFMIVRNNPYFGKTRSEIYYGKSRRVNPLSDSIGDIDYNRVFYYNTKEGYVDYSEVGLWRIPDGSKSYGTALGIAGMAQMGYLMLGVLADPSSTPKYTSFSSDWFNNHTFTARCLPEYRNNMVGASNSPTPDFIVPYKSSSNYKFSRLYIDFKDVVNFGNIYNTHIDWESAYGIAPGEDGSGFWPYFKTLSGNENEDYINYDMESSDIEKLVSCDSSGSPVSLVMDITFAITKNVMNSVANLDGKEDRLDRDAFLANNVIKLLNHREIVSLGFYTDSSLMDSIQINRDSDGSSQQIQLKLDICDNNSSRLLNLIKNNNILYRVINKVRANGDLDASKGESLIPIAIAFRILGKVSEDISPDDWGRTDWTGREVSDEYKTKCSNLAFAKDRPRELVSNNYIVNFTGDNITSSHSVNPLNVLGLLDLEYKMTKLSPINSRSQDAYTVLPVID